MSYRSVFVVLDHAPMCGAHSHAAMRLAKALDRYRVGVAPAGQI